MPEIIRVAEVTDLHIDITNRFDETVRVLDWIAEDVGRRNVDVGLVGGDVFERKPTRVDSLAAGRFVRKYVQNTRHGALDGVYGNHDVYGCLDDLAHHDDEDEASVYGPLADERRIKFYSRPAVHRVAGLQIACLPWPRYQGKMGDSYQEGRDHLANVLRGLGQEMDAHPGPRLFLGHVNIIGAKVSELSQPLVPGTGIDVGTEDLALVRAHAYFFGHIHFGQRLIIGGRPGIYPGSPKCVNWGETETKYYAIVELDAHTGEVRDVEMIPTPCHRMIKLEAVFEHGGLIVDSSETPIAGAEIRLRYQTPAEHLAAARASAEQWRRIWLEQGAVDVKLEDDIQVEIHARVPEITAASSLPDKTHAMRRARGETIESEREERLDAKLAMLESEMAERSVTVGEAAFNIESLHMCNMGPAFPGEIEIDFTQIPGRLIAITGDNMAGKTTFLECMGPGVAFRDCPTRGPLKELAGPGSFLEAVVVSDRRYRIRHDNDGTSSGQSMVFDEQGNRLLENRNVSTYDAWAKNTLPPPSLFFASLFTQQGSKGFLGLTSGERKGVVLRAIGVERYEALAKGACQRALLAKKDHAAADGRVQDERGRYATLSSGPSVDVARLKLEAAQTAAEISGKRVDEVRAEALSATQANRERETHVRQRQEEITRADQAVQEVAQRCELLDLKLRELETTIGQEAEVTAAARRVAELDPMIAEARGRLDAARDGHKTASRALAEGRASVQRAKQALARADAELADERRRDNERQALAAQVATIQEHEVEVEGWAASLRDAEAALATLQEKRAADDGTRITLLRGGLTWYVDASSGELVSDKGCHAWNTLTADDAEIAAAVSLPKEMLESKATLKRLAQALKGAQEILAQSRQAQARLDAMAPKLGLVEHRDAAATASVDAESHLRGTEADFDKLDLCRATDAALINELTRERDDLGRLASLLPVIESAKAKHVALSGERSSVAVESGQARAALHLVQSSHREPLPPIRVVPDVASVEASAKEADRARSSAQTELALAERSALEARASSERLQELVQEGAAAADELADWTRLAAELGRDGLQALEIDAAGPEISALTNQLLHECFGTRFTVRIETAPRSEDSSQEPCEAHVFDSTIGRWILAKRLSGGGKVVVGEALSWAFVIFACRRWGIRCPTIVRDESGANLLSPENTIAWVSMQRRAMDMVGASRVLIVSHDPAVQERVDACIHISHGTISVLTS